MYKYPVHAFWETSCSDRCTPHAARLVVYEMTALLKGISPLRQRLQKGIQHSGAAAGEVLHEFGALLKVCSGA